MKRWMATMAVLAGCRCADDPEPALQAPPHYAEWDGLVRAAARGDVDTARIVARDLTEGPVPGDGDGAATVGAALGMVQLAEPEELADAVASAASGCGSCHAATGATPLARPAWTHHTAADWVVHGVVWNDVRSPPGPIDGATYTADVAATLTTCVGCHAVAPAK